LEELLWICHRIAVMNHGRVVAVLDRAEATKERIMTAAAGTATSTDPSEPADRSEPSDLTHLSDRSDPGANPSAEPGTWGAA